jgi:site-specific recombinase XerD
MRKSITAFTTHSKKKNTVLILVAAVNRALKEGFNPFQNRPKAPTIKAWTTQQAVLFFKQKLQDKGIEESSIGLYESTVKRFIKWLIEKNIHNDEVNTITETYIEIYLDEQQKKNNWSNRHYNNERNFLKTIFIFLHKKGIVKINPCLSILKKKIITKKHRFYDEKLLKKVLDVLKQEDPYLYFACQCVYYLCIRSEKELKYFKVGNIFPERKQVLITGEDSKTDKDRFIPMPDEMLKVFQERKIFDYPSNHYVFFSAS